MTAIVGIYAALAALDVKIGGTTVPVRNYDEQKKSVVSADTPIRLLLPLAPESEAREGRFIAMGNLTRVTWQITDRMLFKPISQGKGINTAADDLVEYVNNYIEAIRSNRALTAQSHIVSYNFVATEIVYPDIQGTEFFGVDAILEIEEIVSG